MEISPIFFLLSPLTFLLLFYPSSSLVNINDAQTIQEMCKQTENSSLCVSSLESDTRSNTANPHELARISMQLALVNGSSVSSYISQLEKQATQPDMKTCLAYCTQQYEDHVLFALNEALGKFDSHENNFAIRLVSGCVSSIVACEDCFKETTPVLESPLSQRNEVQSHLCGISCDLMLQLIE
ncbi:putative invertase inhibitor [Tasmannia lanceolata]|uniref:putative invertase inhibitor n=1 Tax=Tasmannia lanceolata TaxID=3420 RepID=UPI004062C99E